MSTTIEKDEQLRCHFELHHPRPLRFRFSAVAVVQHDRGDQGQHAAAEEEAGEDALVRVADVA